MIKPHNIVINNKRQGIDFGVMGFDYMTTDFLNWCMKNRENLEFIKLCKTLDLISTQAILHFNHESDIKRIDDARVHTKI